ncbi:MAG: hypothetical protein ABJ263_14300 [Tateyamaria sp.]|uniref:hypothetical protein n=1 Tax=Tateyamaria sp. TaxID=1929288 RepID=UPI00326A8913
MAEMTTRAALTQLAGSYLDPQAYDIEALKAYLQQPHKSEVSDAFHDGLNEMIALEGMDQARWEALTGQDFADGDEWLDYIEALFEYLFEDGPFVDPNDMPPSEG